MIVLAIENALGFYSDGSGTGGLQKTAARLYPGLKTNSKHYSEY